MTWRRRSAGVAAAAVLILVAVMGVRHLGGWLIVEDPLVRARAIVVLSGDTPFRAIEAAQVYRGGFAREVWLTRPANPVREAALARLGIDDPSDDALNRLVLERSGVPPAAIVTLPRPIANTADEIHGVRERLGDSGEPVIIVTSKIHSRRVRAIWSRLGGKASGLAVRNVSDDPYDGRGWWRNTHDANAVTHEALGLLNVWAGFLVKPMRAGGDPP